MKSSTIMAVFAVAVAVAVSGCRYDKSADGADAAAGADDAANVSDISTENIDGADGASAVSVVSGADGADGAYNNGAGQQTIGDNTTLFAALASGKSFDEIYGRCNDANFAPVYFGFDSTVIPAGELAKVDAVKQHLDANANRVVIIEGNCDERGSNEYNMSLGQSRAEIVRNYLVQLGVSSDRIQTRSNGEEKPIALGNDESAWSQNRRGDFLVFQR